MSEDTFDDMLTGGAKPVRFDTIGATVEGQVVRIRRVQATDFTSGDPLYWQANRRRGTGVTSDPVMTRIFTVQTTLQEDDDDDGLRDIYAERGVYTAISAAVAVAFPSSGAVSQAIGWTLKVQFFQQLEPPKPSMSGRKLYRARFTPKPAEQAEQQGRDTNAQ